MVTPLSIPPGPPIVSAQQELANIGLALNRPANTFSQVIDIINSIDYFTYRAKVALQLVTKNDYTSSPTNQN